MAAVGIAPVEIAYCRPTPKASANDRAQKYITIKLMMRTRLLRSCTVKTLYMLLFFVWPLDSSVILNPLIFETKNWHPSQRLHKFWPSVFQFEANTWQTNKQDKQDPHCSLLGWPHNKLTKRSIYVSVTDWDVGSCYDVCRLFMRVCRRQLRVQFKEIFLSKLVPDFLTLFITLATTSHRHRKEFH